MSERPAPEPRDAPPFPSLVLVSDSTPEGERLAGLLRVRGYSVADVPIRELNRRMQSLPASLIVCDLDAPSAREALSSAIAGTAGSPPAVVLIAASQDTLAAAAETLGAAVAGSYVRPVDLAAALRQVETLLGAPSGLPGGSLMPAARSSLPSYGAVLPNESRGAPSARWNDPPAAIAVPAAPRVPSDAPAHEGEAEFPSGQDELARLRGLSIPPVRDSSSPPGAPSLFTSDPSTPPSSAENAGAAEHPSNPWSTGAPELSSAVSLGPASSESGRADGLPSQIPEAELSPELVDFLQSAEQRVREHQAVASSRPPPKRPTQEAAGAIDAEVLAALDEPLHLEQDSEAAGSAAAPRTAGGSEGSRSRARTGTQGAERRGGTGPGATGIDGRGTHTEAAASELAPEPRSAHPAAAPPRPGAPAFARTPTATGTIAGTESQRDGGHAETGHGASPHGPAETRHSTAPVPAGVSSVRPQSTRRDAPTSAPPALPRDAPTPPPPAGGASAQHRPAAGSNAPAAYEEAPAPTLSPDELAGAATGSEALTLAPPSADRSPDRPLLASTTPPGRPASPIAELPPIVLPPTLGPGDSVRVVAQLIRARHTASLALESDDGLRRVIFRDGDFVTAASGVPGESLVDFLAQRGALPQDTIRDMGRKIPPFGRHAGAALIAHGHLRQDELWPILRAHAEWVIGRSLTVERGVASLEQDIPARLEAEPPVFGGATGAEIFVELVRRVVPSAEASARMGGAGTRLVAGPARSLLGECALAEQEQALVGRARDASLGQLVSTGAADAPAVLYALVELGVLARAAPSARPDPPDGESTTPAAVDRLDDSARRQRILARRALVDEGDYFALLGLPRNATPYDVRRAYLELRREFDPHTILTPGTLDLGDDVQEILEVLTEAFEILRDQVRRDRYRRALEASP